MTGAKLYRKPNTDLRICAVEEQSVRWTKFTEDQTSIADLMQNTKEEFEIMNNEGYEDDDVNTAFTIIDDSIATLTSISERFVSASFVTPLMVDWMKSRPQEDPT
jgi:hypothetical protein